MPSNTPNYNLAIYDNLPAGDQLENFLDYRTAQAGVGATSNMALIDDAMNDNAVAITALEAKKNIIAVPAVFDSPNTYLATVSGYTVYGTNDVIDVVLDTDSDATVQININSLGLKSLMKINSSGTPVNLDNTNLLADRHYLFSYDGTRWVWIGATSADQIDIGGTAANLVAIASDGSLEDSTVPSAGVATKELDNLGTVAINTDLVSDTDDTDSLGSAAKAWKALLAYATRIKEKAAAAADVAGWGEFWVKTATPNIPMFTNDAGTDFNLVGTTAISGAKLEWVSVSAHTVHESDPFFAENGDVLQIASAIATTGLTSLAVSTWYHIYAYLSAGATVVETNATSPVSWKGTARSKSGSPEKRYLGSILTDSSGDIYDFLHNPQANLVLWPSGINAAPFRVLSAGTATSITAVSVAGATPVTATSLKTLISNDGSQYVQSVDPSDAILVALQYPGTAPTQRIYIDNPIYSGQNIHYKVLSGGSMSVDVAGFYFDR